MDSLLIVSRVDDALKVSVDSSPMASVSLALDGIAMLVDRYDLPAYHVASMLRGCALLMEM